MKRKTNMKSNRFASTLVNAICRARNTSIVALTLRLVRLARIVALALVTGIGSLSYAAIPASERVVLQALYTNTNGANWNNNTNWNGAAGTECTWFGITCSAGDVNVTRVELATNRLVGTLPATLNQLTASQILRFSSNQLSGTTPSLSGLASLQEFSVNNNQLTGTIPSLTGLASLQAFATSSNRLTGTIPALSGSTSLQQFYVSNNQLTGAIPSLAGLTSLLNFAASNNQLSGAIPSLTGLASLRNVYVFGNQLSGAIPSLAGLTSLQNFVANTNQLTGSIPSLTGLASLVQFNVRDNQLRGTIPSLAGLTSLEFFIVAGNQLTGNVPAVPSPSALRPNDSELCPNQLTPSVDAAWDVATGSTPWSAACTAAIGTQILTFGAPPTLVVGGSGTVTVTVSPLPTANTPIVFSSLTPTICSVNASSGLVTVLPATVAGNTCTIAANKAGVDEFYTPAAQVEQSIVITALVTAVATVPTLGHWSLLLLALLAARMAATRLRKR